MFYSTEVLRNRRSSLGVIWSAAWGRKLARSSVLNIDIDQTCDQLMDPEVPQALRLQAVLASGIVKIHERKTNYLKEDAEHAMRRLCDIDSGKKRSIDLDEKQVRKKRITMMNSQYESRQTLDLFFGHGVEAHNDFHFGEPCLYNSLEEDYFIPEGNDPELVMGFSGNDGIDQRNYIMDSPENIPDFDNAIISGGIQDHFEMDSPTSVYDQATISVKPKRKRKPKLDESIVDWSAWLDQSSRLDGHREDDGRYTDKLSLGRKFASFSSQRNLQKSYLDFCLEKVHIRKGSRKNIQGWKKSLDEQQQFHPEAEFFDGFDPRGAIQGEVEIEKLRHALYLTPNHKFGNPSNSKSMPDSSGDLSREDTNPSNRSSVQKDRLSGLFNESRYDLENDTFVGRCPLSEEDGLNELDNFQLKETDPSQDLLGSFARFHEWEKSSHTMEILTKARLCSKAWGAASILLLDDLTSHLNRHEAAAMFHHILVGSSSGMIRAHQDYAYGPITIEFDF